MRLIPGDECARVYSFLGGRPYCNAGCGAGAMFGRRRFSPLRIPGCKLWCSGNTGAHPTAVVLNGGTVSQWTDLTGGGHHIVQATALNQPAWIVGGSGGLLRFDGLASFMNVATFGLAQPLHYFIAANWTYAAGAHYMFNGTAATCGLYISGAPTATMFAGAGAPAKAFTSAQWYAWDFVFSGAASKIALGGGAQTTGNSGAANPGGFALGGAAAGASLAQIDITQLIIYDHEIVGAERAMLTAFQRAESLACGVTLT